MAKRELTPACLEVGQACLSMLPSEDFVIGCSGGADSMALVGGAAWAARNKDVGFVAVVIDHGLQPGSGEVARTVAARLTDWGVEARVIGVEVRASKGLEADARDARLAALASEGKPVLLGHTLDDQAETVLLGLARGSGTRSLSGMAAKRGVFVRPLLGVRRSVTRQACLDWGIEVWDDPHNGDPRFARVRVRERVLPVLEAELGPGIAQALARTARLARADADALDVVVLQQMRGQPLPVRWLFGLDDAERSRQIVAWLRANCGTADSMHVEAVDELVVSWRGQKGVDVPGGRIVREKGLLVARATGSK